MHAVGATCGAARALQIVNTAVPSASWLDPRHARPFEPRFQLLPLTAITRQGDRRMNLSTYRGSGSYSKPLSALLAFAAVALTLLPGNAQAIPAFNRQTGQNCVACHAGGQFPELTPYGRLFKLTGYTIGQRAVPISAMVVAGMARVANTDPQGTAAQFDRNGETTLATASLLLGGKVTDNIGAFAQVT